MLNVSNINPKKVEHYSPNFVRGFRKAKSIMDKIKTRGDVELYMLKGRVWLPAQMVYMVAVRQLSEFIQGFKPLQMTPNHIEASYDYIL